MLNVYLFRFFFVFHANIRLSARLFDMQQCKMSASTHTPRNVRSLTPTSVRSRWTNWRKKQTGERNKVRKSSVWYRCMKTMLFSLVHWRARISNFARWLVRSRMLFFSRFVHLLENDNWPWCAHFLSVLLGNWHQTDLFAEYSHLISREADALRPSRDEKWGKKWEPKRARRTAA